LFSVFSFRAIALYFGSPAGPYLVLPDPGKRQPALICSGAKSGSPALKLQTSIPSAFIAFALAAIAKVIERRYLTPRAASFMLT